MGPTVNKGMLRMTAVESQVAITMLMMVQLKKNEKHVICGMRNLDMDRERQKRGRDEVNCADLFCKYEHVYVSSNWRFEGHKTKSQESPAQNYIA